MTNKSLDKLYEHSTEDYFTTKQLKDFGFSSTDIKSLVDDNTIIRVERGIYIISTYQLFKYSLKAKEEATPYKSQTLLEKCYKRYPKNKDICIEILRTKLLRKDTNDTEKYIMDLYENIENPNQLADANLFLYTLNFICQLSPELRDKANTIELKDILLEPGYEKRGIDIYTQNEIRTQMYYHRFAAAINTYKNIIEEVGLYSLKDVAIKQLIYNAISKAQHFLQRQITLIENGKIDELVQLYYSENIKRKLKRQEQLPYYVAGDLNNIKQTGIVPYPKFCDVDNLFALVKTKNYDIALETHKKYLEEKGIEKEKNPLYLLLEQLCHEIRKKTGQETDVIEEVYKRLNKTEDIILLQGLSIDEINKITEALKRYPDVCATLLEEQKPKKIKKYLLLRKTEYLGEVNISSILHQAKDAYTEKNYDEAITLYKKALKTNNPRGNVYSNLGKNYIEKEQYRLALDYYIVAKCMQKYEKNPTSYDHIISELTSQIEQSPQEKTQDLNRQYFKSIL